MYRADKPLSRLIPRNRPLFMFSVIMLTVVHPTILGYDSMMIGSILNLELYVSYFHLTPVTIGLNTASMWIGSILSGLSVVQFLNDKYGRKFSIIVGLCILIVGVVLQSAAQNIGMFVVGRIFLGFGSIIGSATSIILISELVQTNERGFFLGLAFTSFSIGSLISSGVTYACRNVDGTFAWRIPSIIQGAPEIVALLSWFFIPESPRWLLKNGYTRMATEIISIVEQADEVTSSEIIQTIIIQMEDDKARYSENPWKELISSKINLHRLLIIFTHAFLVEMAGSSVGSYYLAILLEQAGISSSTERLQITIALSAFALVVSFIGCTLFDKIGRKKQALISLTIMIITLIILGALIKEYSGSGNNSGMYAAIAMIFIFTGSYAFSFTPMTTLYPPELFPFRLRSSGVVLFNILNNCFGLISSFILPIAMNNIGWKYYIINGCYNVVFLPVIYFLWVETKGVDLDHIDELFLNIHGQSDGSSEIDLEGQSVEEEHIFVNLKS